jgi:hypothetical protein
MLRVDCKEFETSSGKNGMHMQLVFIGMITFPNHSFRKALQRLKNGKFPVTMVNWPFS